MALAHTIGSKVEAAYRRGNLFDKRRNLMEAWADWCAGRATSSASSASSASTAGGVVVPIRGAA